MLVKARSSRNTLERVLFPILVHIFFFQASTIRFILLSRFVAGLHRYCVVVYKQNGQLQPKEPFYSEADCDRKFSLHEFEKKYSLGKPIAANFYQAKYDEAVKELYLENEEKKNREEGHAKGPGLPSV